MIMFILQVAIVRHDIQTIKQEPRRKSDLRTLAYGMMIRSGITEQTKSGIRRYKPVEKKEREQDKHGRRYT